MRISGDSASRSNGPIAESESDLDRSENAKEDCDLLEEGVGIGRKNPLVLESVDD